MSETLESIRVDKWLWAARFFKTRNKAKIAVSGGKVHVNGDRCKVSRTIKPGDVITLSRTDSKEDVLVTALSDQRGNATMAQELYEETKESIDRREEARAARLLTKAGLSTPKLRPTKKNRRELLKAKRQRA
ncbi:MAG: S4 domain-containing protein [Gammaproteobacteria bacterium]|nr:S4 domain-containing protein [Gammaproteobacteria bacterium]